MNPFGHMKALTVRQPWAWALMEGGKDIENRKWATTYRGPLAIHAAAGMTRQEYCRAADYKTVIRISTAFYCGKRPAHLCYSGLFGQYERIPNCIPMIIGECDQIPNIALKIVAEFDEGISMVLAHGIVCHAVCNPF